MKNRTLLTSIAAALASVGAFTSAHAATVTFQEGVGGYTGTVDTWIDANQPTFEYSTDVELEIANNGTNIRETLIRFENIFGNGAGQIALGSTITSATLTFSERSGGGTTSLHRMLTSWNATDTYGDIGPLASGTDYLATADDTESLAPTFSLTVTNTVQAWSDGTSNFGWTLLKGGNTGRVHSSEATTLGLRPELSITVVPEPSSYAAVFGALVLTLVVVRRRR